LRTVVAAGCDFEREKHHRLYAEWSFNFGLSQQRQILGDTTGLMPSGVSTLA
jgi:hypothetical protein